MTKEKRNFIEWLAAKYSLNIEKELKLWKEAVPDEGYLDELFDIALMEYGLPKAKITSHSRNAEIVEVRSYMMYLLRTSGWGTFKKISLVFGGLHHSTTLHAVDKIRDRLEVKDPQTMTTKARFDKHIQTIEQ
jgi:chromosomal replication initiation ATPase DnaA